MNLFLSTAWIVYFHCVALLFFYPTNVFLCDYSVTRRLNYLFNIWPLKAMNICPMS